MITIDVAAHYPSIHPFIYPSINRQPLIQGQVKEVEHYDNPEYNLKHMHRPKTKFKKIKAHILNMNIDNIFTAACNKRPFRVEIKSYGHK